MTGGLARLAPLGQGRSLAAPANMGRLLAQVLQDPHFEFVVVGHVGGVRASVRK